MSNKATVKQFIENLTKDRQKAYELFDEDISADWPGSGMVPVKGKENLIKLFEKNGHNEIVSQKTENLLGDGDHVFGNGSVISEHSGKKITSHFADLYQLKNGKIISLISHVIVEK